MDLWIPPDIKPTEDLIQKVLCEQMQNEVNLEEYKGGCYSVDCNNCILDQAYLPTFIIWTTSSIPQSSQHDLF